MVPHLGNSLHWESLAIQSVPKTGRCLYVNNTLCALTHIQEHHFFFPVPFLFGASVCLQPFMFNLGSSVHFSSGSTFNEMFVWCQVMVARAICPMNLGRLVFVIYIHIQFLPIFIDSFLFGLCLISEL